MVNVESSVPKFLFDKKMGVECMLAEGVQVVNDRIRLKNGFAIAVEQGQGNQYMYQDKLVVVYDFDVSKIIADPSDATEYRHQHGGATIGEDAQTVWQYDMAQTNDGGQFVFRHGSMGQTDIVWLDENGGLKRRTIK